jgi:2-amino-4-hydroxy-6-hydroxymethyldihydropteridine diphosphokinase
VSPLYETEPVGGPEQDPYLNAAAVVDTALGARDLLDGCLDLERERGRERRERWGPRTLDIDLLLFGSETHREPGLTVPHPRLLQRRFALQPLVDAWPDAALPDGEVLSRFLSDLAGQPVECVDRTTWWDPDQACAGGSPSSGASST